MPAVFPVMHTESQWRSLLSPAAYDVLRRQGTEVPFSSKLDLETRAGTYFCTGCALPLFSSDTKYDSHTGGRASGNRCPTRLPKPTTRASGWIAPKSIASGVVVTSVTSFLTDRRQPVSATA